MKNKLIIGVIIGLVGISILISGLFEKRNVHKNEPEMQIASEIVSANTTTTETTKTTKKVIKTTTKKIVKKTTSNENGYKLTHYGWDCKGCGGNTASGYNVKNTIYYNDKIYGKVRIVAMKNLPLYSVIKIKNYKLGGDIIAIVLDRGVGSGVIDLLVESEKKSSQLGIQKGVQIEILRRGK